jgi:hypothetical protein
VIARALQDPVLKRGAKTMASVLARNDGTLVIIGALERLASHERR